MAGQKISKSQFISTIADKSGLSKKEAAAVLEAMNGVVVKQLKSAGEVIIPGLLKLTVVKKAATPERPGKNPFTGEAITIKAKPARKVVKARPVKALKDAV